MLLGDMKVKDLDPTVIGCLITLSSVSI